MADSDGDLRTQGALSRASQRAKAYSTGELPGPGALFHASQRAHAERVRRAELVEALRREACRTGLVEDDPERALVRDAIRELSFRRLTQQSELEWTTSPCRPFPHPRATQKTPAPSVGAGTESNGTVLRKNIYALESWIRR